VAVITRTRAVPAAVKHSPPSVWWLSPVTVSLFIAVVSIVPTALISDLQFRTLWRTPKSITPETLLLFGCGAGALAFGALIMTTLAPATRPLRSQWPVLSESSFGLLRRASTVLTTVTVIGYAGFAVLVALSGMSLAELITGSAAHKAGVEVRDVVGTIPGVTTMTQFGVAAVVVSTTLLVHGYSRAELAKLLVVIGCALPRAYIFSERLAILELVVPMTVIFAAHLSVRGGLRRKLMQVIPVVGFFAVIAMFGFFEYFRSWTYYRTHTSTSYVQFVASRFAGYYTTALNNGQLVLEYLQWPIRIPYNTLEALWTAPGVQRANAYELLGGHEPPHIREDSKSIYTSVLNHYGNPEFNNQSGYVGAFVDYGRVGGVVCMLLIGLLAGFLYRQFCQGKPVGLFVYPVVFIGLVELPRYIYWAQGRATYAWIGLLVVALLVSRSEARAKAKAGP
jgi:oligosaccharide repeat unit polymerase